MATDERAAGQLLPQAVLGGLIIVFGLLLTADNLGWMHARSILVYWPVGLIVLGASIVSRHTERRAAPRAHSSRCRRVLTVGRLLGWHFNAGILWPLFLVAMGIMILLRGQRDGDRECDD